MLRKDYIFLELSLKCFPDTGLTLVIILNSEIIILFNLKKNLTYE